MPFSSHKLIQQVSISDPSAVRNEIKGRLQTEHIDKYFSYRDTKYYGNKITIKNDEVILISFRTLKDYYPSLYDNSSYNLLVVFNCISSPEIDSLFFSDLDKLHSKANFDSIVFITKDRINSATLTSLKRLNCYVIQIEPTEISSKRNIENFVLFETMEYEEGIYFNLYVEYILKRLKKLFHMILSEIAAPIYDLEYAKKSPATKAVMEYEEDIIHSFLESSGICREDSKIKIVDVGCGTGRHSFLAREISEKIIAFDISPSMIDQAKKQKRAIEDDKIHFSVLDFEYESMDDEYELSHNVDLVIASFGMGSFIEDTDRMLRRFYQWLKPNGMLFISFYNSTALLNTFEPVWNETALSANINVDNETLKVKLPGDIAFYIYCKAFNDDVENMFNDKFDIIEKHYYPTLMSIMPSSTLLIEEINDLFRKVDLGVAKDEDNKNGHYVMLIAKRKSGQSIGDNLKCLLRDKEIPVELKYHRNAYSIEDISLELGEKTRNLIKSVVLEIGDRHASHKEIIIIAILGSKRVSLQKISKTLKVPRNKINFAGRSSIFRLGFPLGGVSPIPIEGNSVRYFIDDSILKSRSRYMYCGSGESGISLRFRRVEIKRIFEFSEKISVEC